MIRRMVLASVRGHLGRFAAGSLAILLGVAFVAAVLTVTSSAKAEMRRQVGEEYVRADQVIDEIDIGNDGLLTGIGGLDGVDAVSYGGVLQRVELRRLGGWSEEDGGASGGRALVSGSLAAVAAEPELRWQRVDRGELPSTSGEIALSPPTAEDLGVGVGDSVAIALPDRTTHEVRVVGLLPRGVSQATAVVSEETFTRLVAAIASYVGSGGGLDGDGSMPVPATGMVQLLVKGSIGEADAREVAGAAARVRDVETVVTEAVAAFTGGIDMVGALLLGFAGIALFVALLVVANTFTIVIAQRSMELALLRCAGAVRSQVFRLVLAESVVLGAGASAVGVVGGLGLAAVGLDLFGRFMPELGSVPLQPTVGGLVISAVLGTLAAVLAGIAPARRATRVPPLAALRSDAVASAAGSAGGSGAGGRRGVRTILRAYALRLVASAAFLAAAVSLITMAIVGQRRWSETAGPEQADPGGGGGLDPAVGMLFGVAGGALSFLGVLFVSPLLVPVVLRLLGRLVKTAAPVAGRVAVDNAVRNPRRTAATTAALLVGVTLISTLLVGAAGAQATSDRILDEQMPIDLVVSSIRGGETPEAGEGEDGEAGRALPAETVEAIRDVPGVESTVVARTVGAGVVAGEPIPITAVDTERVGDVVRDTAAIAGLTPGMVVLAPTVADRLGVVDGDTIEVAVGDLSTSLAARVVGEALTPSVLVSGADLEELIGGTSGANAPGVITTGVWIRLAADADSAVGTISELVERTPGLAVDGAAPMRLLYQQIIDVMVLVAIGFLAMAVLIALIGVGNTLSLSVLERLRENALLRALGLTRRQLRATLSVEALLLAGTAVVLGIGMGMAYGYLGTWTMFAPVEQAKTIGFAVPWARLGLVVLVALGAGVLASVLPARRAARTPPAGLL